MTTSTANGRNQLAGTIHGIRRGEKYSEVKVNIGGAVIITSVVDTDSIDALGLNQGSRVFALFRSAEVALAGFGPD